MAAANLLSFKGCWDALIVGGGPAGAAVAITLARYGWQVLIVEKRSTLGAKFGESLPPAAVGLVEQLIGPLDKTNLLKHGMSKTAGNVSCWQSAEADVSDFFYTPKGFGLCIDRAKFDPALVAIAEASGAQLQLSAQFIQCLRHPHDHNGEQGKWAVEIQGEAGREWHHAKYLIDGSGRQSVVANALGVARQQKDQLFALGQRFVADHQHDGDRFTRLEASVNGWWYSNRLPQSAGEPSTTHRLVVFHTDRDLACAKRGATSSGFADLMSESSHITGLLEKYGYLPVGKIRGASAASERLTQFAGDAWMAVGDAAQAYDPLSSQGITKALGSGTMAGQLLHYALNHFANDGNRSAEPALFKRYRDEQERLWTHYLQQHRYYYSSQPRWQDHSFWRRRGHMTSGTATTMLREGP